MKKHMKAALLCGILGCLCYGGGDWLMMHGNPAYRGTLSWLTEGVATIPQWRYNLAMALAFPGIILYGIALFAVEGYIKDGKQRRVYHYLNAFGLTPWIALHLFYVMILTLFSWMHEKLLPNKNLDVRFLHDYLYCVVCVVPFCVERFRSKSILTTPESALIDIKPVDRKHFCFCSSTNHMARVIGNALLLPV